MAAFYRATLHGFLSDQPHTVLGCLTAHVTHNELQRRQIKAWEREIDLLRLVCGTLLGRFSDAPTWSLLLEYPIPRRQKRLDAVVLAHDVILCIEFKTEDKAHSLQARRQVEDYALDLRDFHEASRVGRLAPIVVVPKAPRSRIASIDDSTDPVASVRLANEADLSEVVAEVFECLHCENRDPINAEKWDKSPYRPVPTIIEAAEALYAGHNVREIAHSHAGATNLTLTSEKLVEIIQAAQVRAEKVICFVTGVPGAGKTLAGLNIVHNPALRSEGRPAGVFLSGNGPLVKIVSAAITRDHKRRIRESGGERTV